MWPVLPFTLTPLRLMAAFAGAYVTPLRLMAAFAGAHVTPLGLVW